MKRILITILLLVSAASPVFAAYDSTARLTTVGATMLTKKSLPTLTYKATDAEISNADIQTTNVLYVSKTNLKYAGNDNETSAVIAKELGAIINASASKNELVNSITTSLVSSLTDTKTQNTAQMANTLSLYSMSEKDKMAADITGVDLMISSGYNPLAMIVLLGKMDGSLVETIKGEPANIKRTMNIYDYLSYNYPDKVKAGYACQEYKNFVAYIQPTITERNSNPKALKKFQKKQAKAKKERAKQIAKYKMTGGVSGWDVSKTLLNNWSTSTTTSTSTSN